MELKPKVLPPLTTCETLLILITISSCKSNLVGSINFNIYSSSIFMLEFQSSLSGCFCYCFDTTMILVTGSIKDNFFDTLFLGFFCYLFSYNFADFNFCLVIDLFFDFRIEVGNLNQRFIGQVIYNLSINMFITSSYCQSWSFWRTKDFIAY